MNNKKFDENFLEAQFRTPLPKKFIYGNKAGNSNLDDEIIKRSKDELNKNEYDKHCEAEKSYYKMCIEKNGDVERICDTSIKVYALCLKRYGKI